MLEARRNPKGLGALEEKRLLAGGYDFPELKDLHEDERDVLLDAAALLFLEHNVCFRETDPLRMEPYLVSEYNSKALRASMRRLIPFQIRQGCV